MKNPCPPECPLRTGTCHGECDEYKAFWQHNRTNDKEKLVSIAINDAMHHGITKQRKRAHLMGT